LAGPGRKSDTGKASKRSESEASKVPEGSKSALLNRKAELIEPVDPNGKVTRSQAAAINANSSKRWYLTTNTKRCASGIPGIGE
jgi:hypothetical protein